MCYLCYGFPLNYNFKLNFKTFHIILNNNSICEIVDFKDKHYFSKNIPNIGPGTPSTISGTISNLNTFEKPLPVEPALHSCREAWKHPFAGIGALWALKMWGPLTMGFWGRLPRPVPGRNHSWEGRVPFSWVPIMKTGVAWNPGGDTMQYCHLVSKMQETKRRAERRCCSWTR